MRKYETSAPGFRSSTNEIFIKKNELGARFQIHRGGKKNPDAKSLHCTAFGAFDKCWVIFCTRVVFPYGGVSPPPPLYFSRQCKIKHAFRRAEKSAQSSTRDAFPSHKRGCLLNKSPGHLSRQASRYILIKYLKMNARHWNIPHPMMPAERNGATFQLNIRQIVCDWNVRRAQSVRLIALEKCFVDVDIAMPSTFTGIMKFVHKCDWPLVARCIYNYMYE